MPGEVGVQGKSTSSEVSGPELEKLEALLSRHEKSRSALIPLLQEVQATLGWLPAEALSRVASHLGIPASTVYGVATFYAQFYLARQGRHNIKVCRGTACHVRGSAKIMSALQKKLGIAPGETTPDYEFSLERVACFGSCALAPVVVLDGKVHGRMTPEKTLGLVQSLQAGRPQRGPDEPG